jgi:RNA polymerase sporulation-specific sigma factor
VYVKTFLKPLTTQEETFYLRKCRQGDKAARDVLIERNLRLVAHIVKKYQGVDEDLDDLISIGTIGLIKAVSTYDMTKGSRLATYAARCIDNELLMMLRSRKKFSREVSLYEPIGTDREGNEIRLYDVIESDEEDACMQLALKNDISLLYEKLESVLTDREQLVLKKRYGLYGEKEYTQKEVAASLGISRSYVSRIEKGAIQKLRPCFLPSHF